MRTLLCAGTLALAAAAAAATGGGPGGVAEASATCRGAGELPGAATRRTVRRAVTCLVNRERRAAGLRRVEPRRKLRRAARRHSADMVRHGYFGHAGPGGRSRLSTRLRSVGYWPARAGEALAAGTGGHATAGFVVDAWMGSPKHRGILLGRGWRHVGVGLADGHPGAPGEPGRTFTLILGRRGR